MTVGKLRLLGTTDDCYGISKHGTTFFSSSPNGRLCPMPLCGLKSRSIAICLFRLGKLQRSLLPALSCGPPTNCQDSWEKEGRPPVGMPQPQPLSTFVNSWIPANGMQRSLMTQGRRPPSRPAAKVSGRTFHPLLSAFITPPPPLGPFAAETPTERNHVLARVRWLAGTTWGNARAGGSCPKGAHMPRLLHCDSVGQIGL